MTPRFWMTMSSITSACTLIGTSKCCESILSFLCFLCFLWQRSDPFNRLLFRPANHLRRKLGGAVALQRCLKVGELDDAAGRSSAQQAVHHVQSLPCFDRRQLAVTTDTKRDPFAWLAERHFLDQVTRQTKQNAIRNLIETQNLRQIRISSGFCFCFD